MTRIRARSGISIFDGREPPVPTCTAAWPRAGYAFRSAQEASGQDIYDDRVRGWRGIWPQCPNSSLRASNDLNFRWQRTAGFHLHRGHAAISRANVHVAELVSRSVGRSDDDAVLHGIQIDIASRSVSTGSPLRRVGRIGQQDTGETGEQ